MRRQNKILFKDKKGVFMEKIRLALLSGGVSSEREVSLNSGQQVFEALDKTKYKITKYDPKTDLKRLQQKETIKRYQFINETLKKGQTIDLKTAKDLRIKLDRILTHKVWGYLIFGIILLTIFQAIYDWSSVPMEFIDSTFASLSEWTKSVLPNGAFANLLAEGIIPGFGGFELQQEPAAIDHIKSTISPPNKVPFFNKNLTINDGVLVDYIQNQNKCTLEQANKIVTDFVAHIEEKIEEKEIIEFPKV